MKLIFLLLVFIVHNSSPIYAQKKSPLKNKIVIMEGPIEAISDSVTLKIYPFRYENLDPWIIKETKEPVENGFIKWEIETKGPVSLFNNIFSRTMSYLAEPGDSIYIYHKGTEIFFSGRGAEKFTLRRKVEALLRNIKGKPDGLSDGDKEPATSLEDYFAWNRYLNLKAEEWISILEKNKSQISQIAYLNLKDHGLRGIEKVRLHKFHSIRRSKIISIKNHFGLTNEDLCRIYDSTMDNSYSKWLRFNRNYVFPADYPWDMLHEEDYRRQGKFFRTNESDTPILGSDPADMFVSLYNMIKEKYTGIARETLLAYTFYDYYGALSKVGFTPKIEAILADYYAQSGYPDFKKQVKEFELERREKWNRKYAPDFSLVDMQGRKFSQQQLKNKIAVLDFWFTGCTGCVQMAPALRKVEKHFEKDTNIVFVSISIDKSKDQWLKSVRQGKFTSGGGVQLYTEGKGNEHDVIKKFLVGSFPTLEIVNKDGLFISYKKEQIDPRRDNGKSMVTFLEKQLAILNDGPYVFHQSGTMVAFSLHKDQLYKRNINKYDKLAVQTDGPTNFNISLKSELKIENYEYANPDKLFALSDIEGNFDQFRKLLQSNKIIDESFNWTFGNGHLVFAGDMFDRGEQVTECLWLIYSLEEKAKAAGGYIHFVLGNHEIMNLQGQEGYVKKKYNDNRKLMNKTLTQLYNEDSELGRWLRTKNIVEKIGDILFVHGGISRSINSSDLTLDEINNLARQNYSVFKDKDEYGDGKINLIMSRKTGPFWYRSYYDGKKEMPGIIDSTLEKFSVNRIVTGHTIVADTISVHYGGKIINTDTKHASGKSEALLIEGDKFYRVNADGRKVLLFINKHRLK